MKTITQSANNVELSVTPTKNRGIIPEYPNYRITKYAKCEYCPKKDGRSLEDIQKEVFIEHFPPERTDSALRVMLVGESPGKREMKELRPFIGASGRLLRKALVRTGYIRKEQPIIRLLITNAVKCPCVGPPAIEIMNMCRPALAKEADLFSPDLIIGLGKTAFHALTDLGWEHLLGENRKRHFKYRGFPVRLTYHPAACFHHQNRKLSLYQDLRAYLKWILNK